MSPGSSVPLDLQLADELAAWSTVLDAIRMRVGPATEVRYAAGCGVLGGEDADIEAAVEAARGAEVAILVLGERSGLTAQCTCGETRDRCELGLPGRQAELVAAVAATGTPVVIVLISGRPLSIPREAALAAAVVHAWVPGEAGPQAIAEVLFGDVSPGGKLPVTVPRHVGQVPLFYAHKPSGGRSLWHQDYVDGSHLPLWPFGHGLSYSRFALEHLRISAPTMATDGEIVISVELANVGDRAADEVAQLYVRDLQASVTRPVKELKGFVRIHLAPGQRRAVSFSLAAEQLAFTGVDGELIVEPGRHRVMVGTSSTDLPLQAEFEVVGEPRRFAARNRFFTAVSSMEPRDDPPPGGMPGPGVGPGHLAHPSGQPHLHPHERRPGFGQGDDRSLDEPPVDDRVAPSQASRRAHHHRRAGPRSRRSCRGSGAWRGSPPRSRGRPAGPVARRARGGCPGSTG